VNPGSYGRNGGIEVNGGHSAGCCVDATQQARQRGVAANEVPAGRATRVTDHPRVATMTAMMNFSSYGLGESFAQGEC
jgi:hypothetical protein